MLMWWKKMGKRNYIVRLLKLISRITVMQGVIARIFVIRRILNLRKFIYIPYNYLYDPIF